MKVIIQKYYIHASVEEVWKALTDPEYIDGWGAGKAKMSGDEGMNFSLWGGDVHGKNTKVVKNKLLVQDWISGDWDKPSIATFKLDQDGENTILDFSNENVPSKEHDDIENGWKDYYFGPLKEYLESK